MRLRAPLIAGFCLAGCLSLDAPAPTPAVDLPIAVGTVPLGTLTIDALDGTSGLLSTSITYRNTTPRTIATLQLGLAPAGVNVEFACSVPFPLFLDTTLVNLPPGAVRVIARGTAPRSLNVYVTRADTGGGNLVGPLAGRWTATLRQWFTFGGVVRDSTKVLRSVSNDAGTFIASRFNDPDTVLVTGTLRQSGSTALTHWPGRCAGQWFSLPGFVTTQALPDSIVVRGRGESALTSELAAPDSFRLSFTRR